MTGIDQSSCLLSKTSCYNCTFVNVDCCRALVLLQEGLLCVLSTLTSFYSPFLHAIFFLLRIFIHTLVTTFHCLTASVVETEVPSFALVSNHRAVFRLFQIYSKPRYSQVCVCKIVYNRTDWRHSVCRKVNQAG